MAISMQESTRVHGGNPRRNSLGIVISSVNGEKSVPRYLQASSGSCHDFCKYGKHHELEKKPRLPFARRKMKTRVDDHFAVEVLEESNKKPVVKLKPLRNLETCRLDSLEIIKREVSTKPVGSETSRSMPRKTPGVRMIEPIKSQSLLRKVPAKKTASVQKTLTNSADSESSLSSQNFSERKRLSNLGNKKISSDEPRISPDVKSRLSPRIQKQNASLSTDRLGVSSKLASLKTKEVNLSAKDAISSKRNLSLPCALEASSGGRKSDLKMGPKARTPRLIIVKSQASSRGSLPPKSSFIRVPKVNSSKTTTTGITRGFSSPRASLSSKISISRIESLKAKRLLGLKFASPPSNQGTMGKVDINLPKVKNANSDRPNRDTKLKKLNKELVHEKTLYVIKVETDNKYVDSDVNAKVSVDSSSPLSSSSTRASSPLGSPYLSHRGEQDDESEYETEGEEEPCSDYDESECVEYGEALEVALKNGHRNGEVVPSEDTDGLPVKLRFRRGKVVDIMSETKSPRRLKFRRARTSSESQNCKNDSRMNIKRRDTDESTQDHLEESEKVVLRHQDVQGKKDAQGLLNNVIEETASKLAETRKSKVKALVGAFETVISLRDGSPSSNIISLSRK